MDNANAANDPEQIEFDFGERLDAAVENITAGRPDATDVVATRKTEILLLLQAGISWRRLAYLLQLPEATCRRAVRADPDLAHEKRPEGYGAEIALAKQYAELKAKGYPLADLERWIKARTTYDTSRAKNAHYRREARRDVHESRLQDIARTVRDVVGDDPADFAATFDEYYTDPDTAARRAQQRAADAQVRQAMEVVDYDGET